MIRRLLALLLCALLAWTAGPAAAAAKLKPCPTFADPKGDSYPEGEATLQPLGDPALDIRSVTFKPFGKQGLAIAITVDKMAARPAYAPGNRYEVTFTYSNRIITVYYKDSATRNQEAEVFYQAAVKDEATVATGDVGETVAGNTITITISSASLKGAMGTKFIGSTITKFTAHAYGSFVATNEEWDNATAPASLSYVVGAACK